MARSFAPGSPEAIAFLNSLLAKSGVDVPAADAVFGQEGLSGGIGDGGHAFGPGQFNDAGGVWTGRYPGLSPQQKNAAAWSTSGLSELAQHIASVAGGLHGAPAVQNIVSRFERPADIPGEISRALASYGGHGGSDVQMGSSPGGPAGASMAAAPPAPAPRDNGNILARAILGAIGSGGQLNTGLLLKALGASR